MSVNLHDVIHCLLFSQLPPLLLFSGTSAAFGGKDISLHSLCLKWGDLSSQKKGGYFSVLFLEKSFQIALSLMCHTIWFTCLIDPLSANAWWSNFAIAGFGNMFHLGILSHVFVRLSCNLICENLMDFGRLFHKRIWVTKP